MLSILTASGKKLLQSLVAVALLVHGTFCQMEESMRREGGVIDNAGGLMDTVVVIRGVKGE